MRRVDQVLPGRRPNFNGKWDNLKVEMLRYWEQDPDGTRESMKGFQQLMEELRENNPDDPRKACNALLTEILVQLKKAQQGAEGDAVNRAP